MKQSLRLAHRQPPKPHRHGGLIDSDRIVGRYLDELEAMPTKYRVEVVKPAPRWRRVWRWVLARIGY